MKRPNIWWDEEERFAKRAAAAFPWYVIVPALLAAGVGLVTADQTLLLGALVIVAVGVGSVVLWVATAVPIMFIFVAIVTVFQRLQRLRRRRAV